MSAVGKHGFKDFSWGKILAGGLILSLTGTPVIGAGQLGAGEQNHTPLWRQAADRIIRDSNFWATGVNSVLTVYDEAGQLLGSVETLDELELTEGLPVWKQKSRIKKGQPGLVITLDLGIQKKPGLILKEYDSWTLLRKEVFADTPVEVWKGIETANPDNTATVYLSAATASPLQIVFTVPFSHVLLGKRSFSLTVEYKETATGACLPARALIDQDWRMPFKKRRIHIESEYRDWRPSASAAPTQAPAY